ncbi:MAG TPA: glutamate mutase L, partial [Candidatus Ozemobacteraceae bacterium]|nr:glutamate mutase L [Candidatus Ozemobacteraceae bacterium]
TVEGDLGVYVNAKQVLENIEDPEFAARIADLRAMPQSEREKEFTRRLCAKAVEIGARRHAGTLSDLYTPTGRKQIVRGKDLTAVRWVIGTGGALTRIEGGIEILRSICRGPEKHLLPRPDATVLLDRNYLFSALGTLAQAYPAEAGRTLTRFVTT